MYEVASVRSTVRGGNHSLATWSLVMIDSVCLLFVVGLFCVCVHCHWELSISATVWIVTACTVCMCYMCVGQCTVLCCVQVLQRALRRGQAARLWRP